MKAIEVFDTEIEIPCKGIDETVKEIEISLKGIETSVKEIEGVDKEFSIPFTMLEETFTGIETPGREIEDIVKVRRRTFAGIDEVDTMIEEAGRMSSIACGLASVGLTPSSRSASSLRETGCVTLRVVDGRRWIGACFQCA